MASIAKRPDGRWRARYRDDGGKEHSQHFDRKVDGQRWLDEVTTQRVTSTYVDPKQGRVTVGEWADRWLSSKGNLKPSTRDRYAGILDTHILPHWGNLRLDAVTHDGVQSWVADLSGAGLSAASVVKVHRVLSMLLAYAVRSKRLATNPASGVTLPRVTRAEKRYLRAEHVADLADPAGRGRLVVLMLAYTGIRWGELAALKVSRVDLLRRRIHVAESVTELSEGTLDWGLPKSHERRWVPLPRFLVADLTEHLVGKAPGDLVFASPTGAVLRVRNARRAWFAVRLPCQARRTASIRMSCGTRRRAWRCPPGERQGRAADARSR